MTNKDFTHRRGSQMECAAVIDVCQVLKIDPENALKNVKTLSIRTFDAHEVTQLDK